MILVVFDPIKILHCRTSKIPHATCKVLGYLVGLNSPLFTCPHMHDKSNDILDNSCVVPTSQKMRLLNGAGTIEGMVHTFHWDTALYIYKMHRSNLQR
jgi:hypothetical protein